jgi:hypothetical protein
LLTYWVLAGGIVAVLSFLYAWGTGGLIGAFEEIIVSTIGDKQIYRKRK